MAKAGIKILSETVGPGKEIAQGDHIRFLLTTSLNRGEILSEAETVTLTVGDREYIAGLRYGIEGMRVGGSRRFKASPHLCYGDEAFGNIPENAALVFDVKSVELLRPDVR